MQVSFFDHAMKYQGGIGILFLQNLYSLSDPMAEELIHDRISFRKFLGIKEN
ncbi:MAG: hypothetical protein COA66_06115 [Arcobacter sp.]|nr:MAG: hypothetical protein COA66_06115 [Arcobacter sp.]